MVTKGHLGQKTGQGFFAWPQEPLIHFCKSTHMSNIFGSTLVDSS
jgi:3-hydroxyacyl-CoA dehydrogenase